MAAAGCARQRYETGSSAAPARSAARRSAASTPAAAVLALQRRAGNRATRAYLAAHGPRRLQRVRGLKKDAKVSVATMPGVHTITEVRDESYMVRLEGDEKDTEFVHWLVSPSTGTSGQARIGPASPQAKKPQAETDSGFTIVTDADADSDAQRRILHTPWGVAQEGRTDLPPGGKQVGEPKYDRKSFDKSARIDVEGEQTDEGVAFRFTVSSNPKYMCAPHDLVRVTLEKDRDVPLDTIVALTPDVRPHGPGNLVTVVAHYSWAALAKMLNLPVETPPEEIRKRAPEFGVKAEWLAKTAGPGNAANHFAGGMSEKMGSGKVRLRPLTLEDYERTEASVRITDWNAQEQMREGRPVFDRFSDILQRGKEMATTLEAESEYVVGEADLRRVISALAELSASPLQKSRFGIHSMSDAQTKKYVDTYYDITVDGKPTYMLLQNLIVVRRRTVETDPKDTFLFAVKGRTHELEGEKIRLAAQANLAEGALKTKPERLRQFLTDPEVDNPMARVLADALKHRGVQLPTGNWDVVPVLTVVSHRVKYSMELEFSTAIDFSGDFAEGTLVQGGGKKGQIFSFEFGVGHPGLTTASAGTTTTGDKGSTDGTGDKRPAATSILAAIRASNLAERGHITRPYHVPRDLENTSLFTKADYKQYKKLRDALLGFFGMDKRGLLGGGNKATMLAAQLGVISGPTGVVTPPQRSLPATPQRAAPVPKPAVPQPSSVVKPAVPQPAVVVKPPPSQPAVLKPVSRPAVTSPATQSANPWGATLRPSAPRAAVKPQMSVQEAAHAWRVEQGKVREGERFVSAGVQDWADAESFKQAHAGAYDYKF